MDSKFLPVFRTGPLPARNDITGQHCLVESEFCQRIIQHLQERHAIQHQSLWSLSDAGSRIPAIQTMD